MPPLAAASLAKQGSSSDLRAARTVDSERIEAAAGDLSLPFLSDRLGLMPRMICEEIEAIDAVFQASGGIPRIINLVCENALIFAYVEQSQMVVPRHISLVAQDLQLGTEHTPHTAFLAATS